MSRQLHRLNISEISVHDLANEKDGLFGACLIDLDDQRKPKILPLTDEDPAPAYLPL